MPISSIQDQLLQVTVVGCGGLTDTSWVGKQRPYVCLEYGGQRVRTKSRRGGGTDPYFNEKFEFSLFEGRRFINLEVWISHSLSPNVLIGSGKIQLEHVLTNGYDDNSWPIWGESVRHGTRVRKGANIHAVVRSVGQVKLILHYKKAQQPPLGYPPGPSAYPPAPCDPSTYGQPPFVHHFPPPSPAAGRHHGIYPPLPDSPPQYQAHQVPYAAPSAPYFPAAHGQPPQSSQYYSLAHSSSQGRH